MAFGLVINPRKIVNLMRNVGKVVSRGIVGYASGGPVGAGIGIASGLIEVGINGLIDVISPI